MGRVGRNGTQSQAVLVYNKRQLGKTVSEELKHYLMNEDCRREQISRHYTSAFQQVNPKHLCCDLCSLQCDCLVCPPVQHILEMDLGESDISVPHDQERFVSKNDETELRTSLNGLKDKYDLALSGKKSVCMSDTGHGFSQSVIQNIISDAEHIFTITDLLDNCGVWSFHQANDVLNIFNDIFGDLDMTVCASDFTDEFEQNWKSFFSIY